jgi:hypothetical protein
MAVHCCIVLHLLLPAACPCAWWCEFWLGQSCRNAGVAMPHMNTGLRSLVITMAALALWICAAQELWLPRAGLFHCTTSKGQIVGQGMDDWLDGSMASSTLWHVLHRGPTAQYDAYHMAL